MIKFYDSSGNKGQSSSQQNKKASGVRVSNFLRANTNTEEDLFRPRTLDDIVGRDREKEMLYVMIKSIKRRWRDGDNTVALDHILLYGPPGVGKTTMARAIATELGVNLVVTSGPALEKAADLLGLLTNLKAGDILFIDEIHRLKKTLEEVLYPAMEDRKVDIVGASGDSAHSIRVTLEPFTLIGATTRVGLLSAPLRDRFGLSVYLDLLSPDAIVVILEKLASRDPLIKKAANKALWEIAKRSRGTPRIAIRLYKRVRDLVVSQDRDSLTLDDVLSTLEILGIDELGLDYIDRKLLFTILKDFKGGPVGLKTLAAALGEDPSTIEEVYEPYLIKAGLLLKTSRGRITTDLAYSHFKAKLLQQC